MNAQLLICMFFVGLLGATGPLSLHVDIKRTSLNLLDPVSFAISVINSRKKPIVASFPTSDLYDIAVSAHSKEAWAWSITHIAAQVLRTTHFHRAKRS